MTFAVRRCVADCWARHFADNAAACV